MLPKTALAIAYILMALAALTWITNGFIWVIIIGLAASVGFIGSLKYLWGEWTDG